MNDREIILWRWHFWRWSPLLAFVIIVLAGLYGFYRQELSNARIERVIEQRQADTRDRIHQSCLKSERDEQFAIEDYASTIVYLKGLSPSERNQGINKAVLQSLPKTRRRALISVAPNYCDKPGVGLKEPDPVVPDDPFK